MISFWKAPWSEARHARRSSRRTSRVVQSHLEPLETRQVPSGVNWPGLASPVVDAETNDTLERAQFAGTVGISQPVEIAGQIGDATTLTTDVDWFQFNLSTDSRVQLHSLLNATGESSSIVVSLYGDQVLEFDPSRPLQRPLLARREVSATSNGPLFDLSLDAGAYFVAISGAGNRFFHPFVADSGLAGASSEYGIRVALTNGTPPRQVADQFAAIPELARVSDDTVATATGLGDLSETGHLQVSAAIGDDRFYNVQSSNPLAMNPAADVDLYRFTISGEGSFSLVAEAFAGRIGSALDPALTLYRADALGTFSLVALNNNSLNPTESTNGQIPLFSDSVLIAGLTAGDYFLAVSSSGNDLESGVEGTFDPRIAHSGANGGSVGQYVLDLKVTADAVAPQVTRQSFQLPSEALAALLPGNPTTLTQAPTHLSITFNELVTVEQLAYSAYQQVGQNSVRAVYIQGQDGTKYFPRLQSYNTATSEARFLLLDGLPNGDYSLHVSGTLGLTDFAGNLLIGNDASGDFVTQFTVADTNRTDARFVDQTNNATFETAQNLGVLFPHELQSGITLTKEANASPSSSDGESDFFKFHLLQTQSYFFTLSQFGEGGPPRIQLLNAQGQPVSLGSLPNGQGLLGFIPAGSYVLRLSNNDNHTFGDVSRQYRLEIELGGASENPTPLTSGAAPAAGIRLAGSGFTSTSTPMVFSRETSAPITPSLATIPTNLRQGLNAPAIGLQSPVTTPTSETAIVRLFGFGDLDRLFSMIDSSLRKRLDAVDVTKLELTEADLNELLNLTPPAGRDADEAASPSNETEQSTEPHSATSPSTTKRNPRIDPEAKAPSSRKSSPSAQQAKPRSVQTPVSIAPMTISVDDLVTADIEPNGESTDATSLPLTLALATSLATVLRQRHDQKTNDPAFNTQFTTTSHVSCSSY